MKRLKNQKIQEESREGLPETSQKSWSRVPYKSTIKTSFPSGHKLWTSRKPKHSQSDKMNQYNNFGVLHLSKILISIVNILYDLFILRCHFSPFDVVPHFFDSNEEGQKPNPAKNIADDRDGKGVDHPGEKVDFFSSGRVVEDGRDLGLEDEIDGCADECADSTDVGGVRDRKEHGFHELELEF